MNSLSKNSIGHVQYTNVIYDEEGSNIWLVCVYYTHSSKRSREAVRPELKKKQTFLSLHRWTWTIHEAVTETNMSSLIRQNDPR